MDGWWGPMTTAMAFPFAVGATGGVQVSGGDEALRAKIVQVLFTAPGERIDLPDFGCGLFNLVFEPNDQLLTAAVQFTVGQALTRWLGDEIIPNGVDVTRTEETIVVEVAYTKRTDLSRQGIRATFR
jgi:uncharacterized protein